MILLLILFLDLSIILLLVFENYFENKHFRSEKLLMFFYRILEQLIFDKNIIY